MNGNTVSILVFMDVPLQPFGTLLFLPLIAVSILVFMDVPLQLERISKLIENGMTFQSLFLWMFLFNDIFK